MLTQRFSAVIGELIGVVLALVMYKAWARG